jgi:hypothetical protein
MTDPFRVQIEGGNVFVIGPDGVRVCDIPLLAKADSLGLRTQAERMSIAGIIARLFNEEDARCSAPWKDSTIATTIDRPKSGPQGQAEDAIPRPAGRRDSFDRRETGASARVKV